MLSDLGHYSSLFLVQRATGGWRPVISLSALNHNVTLQDRDGCVGSGVDQER